MGKINEILNQKLEEVKLSKRDEDKISNYTKEFISKLNPVLKKFGGKCFLGGSFSKKTAIRKKVYDVDIFVLFPRKSKGISELLESALRKAKIRFQRLPGSRDYFNVKVSKDFKVEIVPVVDVKKAEEALNVTDVSPLHVKYILGQIKKNKKLPREIRLVKAFCYAQDCYGAESHIKGFSGYCLEILTAHYGSFIKLLKAASKWSGKNKIIVDPSKYYSHKKDVLNELNEAKLLSPLILIDPVQKVRNAAAALSNERLEKFIKAAKEFLAKPSSKYFEKKELNEEKIIKRARSKSFSVFRVHASSKKKKEDTSGAKLLKLHNLLCLRLGKEGYKFEDLWKFEDKEAYSYMIIKNKPKQVILKGPPIKLEKHTKSFKRRWKNWKVKNGWLFASRKPIPVKNVLKVGEDLLEEMGINSFEINEWA